MPKPDRDELDDLQERLGARFRDPELLRAALVHASALPAGVVRHAERLEFLGDAVLDLAVATILLEASPTADEGQLSKQRALLVRTSTLAEKALELGLDERLVLGKGEEQSGGRRKPSILAATYEAVIGAAYRDRGFTRARALVRRHFREEIRQGMPEQDHKTLLQERTQAEQGCLPEYRVVAEEGPAHDRRFVVEVWIAGHRASTGAGSSKRAAAQAAARSALRDGHEFADPSALPTRSDSR